MLGRPVREGYNEVALRSANPSRTLPNLIKRHDEQEVGRVRVKEVVDVFFDDQKLDPSSGHDSTSKRWSYPSWKHL
jgi:hypothetical protein